METPVTSLFVIGLSALLVSGAHSFLVQSHHTPFEEAGQNAEVRYLPRKDGVLLLSFGYRNATADIIWFHAINYFGKHYGGDEDYRWLFPFCDVVTELDPRAAYVFQFGGLMLAWEFNKPDLALVLLDKGVRALPDDWLLRYYRGMVNYYFMKDPKGAMEDFLAASRLPDVNPLIASLAVKLASTQGHFNQEDAIRDLLASIPNATARSMVEKRLQSLGRSKKGFPSSRSEENTSKQKAEEKRAQ